MPNLDKTGPSGKGPNTGRGRGDCEGNGTNSVRGFGRGSGMGLGRRGRCCDNDFFFDTIEEKEKFLLDELENIRKIKNN